MKNTLAIVGRVLVLVLLTVPLLGNACTQSIGTVTSTIDKWDFTIGTRGGGRVSYHAIGPENGEQSGECLQSECHTTVDDLTLIRLTPIADESFRFKSWDGLPANHLSCDAEQQDAAGIILLKVSRDGACIAVFEAAGGGTVPGSGGSVPGGG
jgi:hypothetical protein